MSELAVSSAYAPPTAPVAVGASGIRLKYEGTGGELFRELFVGFLLTAITVGIYMPWFIVGLNKYIYSKTTLQTSRGTLRFAFGGQGGDLFVKLIVGGLLTGITFGIYYPWFLVNLIKFNADSSTAVGEDGKQYKLGFTGTGGELFVTIFVGGLLMGLTFGIYTPWFICKLYKELSSKTTLFTDGQATGSFDFVGQGGELFGTFIVGAILTVITLGIYAAWFNVTIAKFVAQNSRVKNDGRVWGADFTGTGGELFVTQLVGQILTGLTLGIYMFWFMTNLIRFQTDNTSFQELKA